MTSEPTCRRCAECRGASHHWIENVWFGDGEGHPEVRGYSHVCKHCETFGQMCDSCDGLGYVIEDDCGCVDCDCEGVIAAT